MWTPRRLRRFEFRLVWKGIFCIVSAVISQLTDQPYAVYEPVFGCWCDSLRWVQFSHITCFTVWVFNHSVTLHDVINTSTMPFDVRTGNFKLTAVPNFTLKDFYSPHLEITFGALELRQLSWPIWTVDCQ